MKIAIDAGDLRKLVVKAHYADVQSVRAVHSRDCEIRARIHFSVEQVYDALDAYEEEYGGCLDEMPLDPSVCDMLFYTVVSLLDDLVKAGIAHRD